MAKITTPAAALDSSADLANYISFDLARYMIEKRLAALEATAEQS